MSRVIYGFSVLAVALVGISSTATAHHPPRFERCQLFTFTGQLEQIQWSNPHVLLTIQTDSGDSHLVGWLDVRALGRAGIREDTLRVGDRLVVSGGMRTDDAGHEPILVSSIERSSDGWEWSQPLQGC